MKAIVTWQQVTRSEIELENEDLAALEAVGISLDDGPAIAAWIAQEEWLGDAIQDSWYEKEAPEIIDIEPQEDDGTLL